MSQSYLNSMSWITGNWHVLILSVSVTKLIIYALI